MKLERIIRREDGSRVRIVVELTISWNEINARWSLTVWHCGPRKRTWRCVVDHDDYMWRALSGPDRTAESNRRCLQYATRAEVQDMMVELWLSIKPELGKNIPVADRDLTERERQKI